MTMGKVQRGLAPGTTVHGWRSCFRDWVAETTNFSGELAEMALAHTVASKVEKAYRRGNLLERRRELMNAWAAYLAGQSAAVVSMDDARRAKESAA
jgi:integrase